jgi:hypothetical protein
MPSPTLNPTPDKEESNWKGVTSHGEEFPYSKRKAHLQVKKNPNLCAADCPESKFFLSSNRHLKIDLKVLFIEPLI